MEIFKLIPKIASEIGPITKEKTNGGQGYKYRGIDDVLNRLSAILAQNKVFICPEVLEMTQEDRQSAKGGNLIFTKLKVKHTFYASDGSSVSCITVGEGMDSGDKSSNKAHSSAYKYACFLVFCIPTEEMKDVESEDHTVGRKTAIDLIKKLSPKVTENVLQNWSISKPSDIWKLTLEEYNQFVKELKLLDNI